ncbi:MAG TPA: RNA polymerase sigma factor [Rhodanobacteraceae bacterium]
MRRKPDKQRFESLLLEHQRIVFKVARVYAYNAHDRDDLAQEIAAQLWRSFTTFDASRAKFTTWMYRVALNVAISYMRSAKRSGQDALVPFEDACLDVTADSGISQPDAIERDERIAGLHAFIAQLDAMNRALVLLYLEDRSYAEIAGVLGISETNVATKLNRIKQKLRAQMGASQSATVRA